VSVLALLLHAALMLAAAPLVVGLARRLKARLMGRQGPPVLQPVRDILRLCRKQPMMAEDASPLFRIVPFVQIGAIGAAALLVPSFTLGMLTAPLADLLAIGGLLAVARVALALAALDAGTAFGGIGASRAMMFGSFAEPALLLVILTLAVIGGGTNLVAIAAVLQGGPAVLRVSLGLALLALLAVALVENGRIPADNPATHLELTMVHEAMVLDYAGRDLALIELAGGLKLLVWLDLIATAFFPFGIGTAGAAGWVPGLAAWAVKVLVLTTGLAAMESAIAKMRVFRVPEFLGIALLLGLLAAVFLFLTQGFV